MYDYNEIPSTMPYATIVEFHATLHLLVHIFHLMGNCAEKFFIIFAIFFL